MSGLLHKVKDALTGEKTTNEAHVANQGAPEYDDTNTGSGLIGSRNEPTRSPLVGSGTHGSSSTTTGPHSSSVENKLDPRVDSDRDSSRGLTGGSTGTHQGHHTGGTTGTSGMTGSGYDSTTSGPHSSGLANKVDPRVDSDRGMCIWHSEGNLADYYLDGRSGLTGNTTGTGHQSSTGGLTGTHGSSTGGLTGNTTGRDYGSSTTGVSGTTGSSSTSGPHDSSLLNRADPRVDSDRDGSRGIGSGTTGGLTSGTTGTRGTHDHHSHHGHHGHHEDIVHGGDHLTQTANKLDPHVSGGVKGVGLESVTSGSAHSKTGISTGASAESGYGSSTGTGSGLTGSSHRDHGLSGTGTGSGMTGSSGSHGLSGAGTGTGLTGSSGNHGLSGTGTGSGLTGSSGSHGLSGTGTGTGLTGSSGRDHGLSTTGTGSGLTGSSSRDYDSSNTGTMGSNTTSGPHSSAMLNKLDPRVDSDRDGSKTAGGSGTYGSNQTYK
ncbi:MAG: hypothetical protein Q9187_003045 [Circinaria calcarea]